MATTTRFARIRERNTAAERQQRREMARQGKGTRVNVGSTERWVSALAGGMLAAWGLRRRGKAGYGGALVGAELLYRGISGHCPAYSAIGISTSARRERGEPSDIDHDRSIHVRQAVIIEAPRTDVYALCRDLSLYPRVMQRLERVEYRTPTQSRWVLHGPAGMHFKWELDVVAEREGEWIAWRTIEPSDVPNTGTLMFRTVRGGATELFISLEVQPPLGHVGDAVARLFGQSPDQQVRHALVRFKHLVESGRFGRGKAKDGRGAQPESELAMSLQDTGWSVPARGAADGPR